MVGSMALVTTEIPGEKKREIQEEEWQKED
jgi:hypothetical protein